MRKALATAIEAILAAGARSSGAAQGGSRKQRKVPPSLVTAACVTTLAMTRKSLGFLLLLPTLLMFQQSQQRCFAQLPASSPYASQGRTWPTSVGWVSRPRQRLAWLSSHGVRRRQDATRGSVGAPVQDSPGTARLLHVLKGTGGSKQVKSLYLLCRGRTAGCVRGGASANWKR